MSVLLLLLVIRLLLTAMSEPVSGHGFPTPPCVYLLYGTHPATVFRALWAIRDIPNRFILSDQPVRLLLLCCSHCVVNMSNKNLKYGRRFPMFTREKLRAFDLPALSSLCESGSPRHKDSCLILSNAYRSLVPRDGSQAASFADSH